ncbi:glycosyltransferase family 4 protein [Saccharicrinis sp. FJH62]|uniref:glycosyltransferase family 4 protein n=1 Tax=Saccharicrinis sp. FJH62 TaxID=3344657 RepID=UPI0035D462CC
MKTFNGHILHIPRWYPGLNGPQGGVFISKHIASSQNYRHSVINVNVSKGKEIPLKRVLFTSSENVNTYSYFYRSGNKLFSSFNYCIGIYRCIRQLLKEKDKPDLIHAHVLLRTYVVAYVLHILFKRPYIITEHWSGYHYGLYHQKSKTYRFLLKLMLKKAEKVLVVSNRLRNDMLACIPLDKTKLKILPNVAENTSETKPQKQGSTIKIVTVADLKDNIKRVSGVIEAIKKFTNENIEYHIIGDGPDINTLKQLANQLLNEKIYFYGELSNEDVLKKLPEFDFLIQNSQYETFGLVPVEALLSGLPVISTTTGCPEEVQLREAGIFIEPDQQEELMKAIDKMIHTFREYEVIPVQKIISQKFSAETVGAMQEQIYNDILSR